MGLESLRSFSWLSPFPPAPLFISSSSATASTSLRSFQITSASCYYLGLNLQIKGLLLQVEFVWWVCFECGFKEASTTVFFFGFVFVFFNKNLAGDNVPSGDVKAAFTKLNKVFIKWNVCTTLL